jgi:hypothetical protein
MGRAPLSAAPPLAAVPAVLRSEGQRMFLAVTGTLQAIANEVGCKSPQTVANWREGTKDPSPQMRRALWETFGIPEHAWSRRPGASLETEAPPSALEVSQSEAPRGHPSTLEDCLALLSVIREDRMQRGLLPGERVKLADAEARILALRSRLEQAAELSEARYVLEHPAWLRVRRAILKALEAHPLVAKAVADALLTMEVKP